ncbi:MAG: lytic transglycosylase domain-containing protein [Ignavibacteria bacterium]|jgi:hypothetical protein
MSVSKFFAVLLIIIAIVTGLSLAPSIQNVSNSEKKFQHEYKITAPKIPDEAFFAGERMPLENFEVKERLDRELIANTYWHSSMLLYLKRANRWFPIIEPILEKNDVPDDFKYLCVAESNLENVVSPKGATGFWQFMKSTGKKYGLEITGEVDERFNVEKATEAACSYLKDLFKEFNSWTLAAAAYNMGESGLARQIERQKSDNYYYIVLSEETSRYIFRIVAAKMLNNNPEEFGFDLESEDLYPELNYKEVFVRSSIQHWADFAERYDINYKILKTFNPWLRENKLTNKSGKTYMLKIPVGKGVK